MTRRRLSKRGSNNSGYAQVGWMLLMALITACKAATPAPHSTQALATLIRKARVAKDEEALSKVKGFKGHDWTTPKNRELLHCLELFFEARKTGVQAVVNRCSQACRRSPDPYWRQCGNSTPELKTAEKAIIRLRQSGSPLRILETWQRAEVLLSEILKRSARNQKLLELKRQFDAVTRSHEGALTKARSFLGRPEIRALTARKIQLKHELASLERALRVTHEDLKQARSGFAYANEVRLRERRHKAQQSLWEAKRGELRAAEADFLYRAQQAKVLGPRSTE